MNNGSRHEDLIHRRLNWKISLSGHVTDRGPLGFSGNYNYQTEIERDLTGTNGVI